MSLAGLDRATIFCGLPAPDRVVAALRNCGLDTASSAAWATLEVSAPSGRLRINRKDFEEPGGEFSTIILGMLNAVRTRGDPPAAPEAIELLQDCDLMLGLRAEPAFSRDDVRERAICAIAEATEGMIFDGAVLRTSDGRAVVRID